MDRVNSALRRVPVWAVWLICLLPVPLLLYAGMTGGLGREPIKELEHELGEIALQLLIVGLAVTPMRRFTGLNLMKFRRALGLLAFTYVSLHLAVWLFLDVQIWSEIWKDIVKRPYVTIGMVAFLLLIPLAVTSNNVSVRKLGPNWRSLHKLTYVISILSCVHFIWVRKGFQVEPWVYMTVITVLIALRFVPMRQRTKRASAL